MSFKKTLLKGQSVAQLVYTTKFYNYLREWRKEHDKKRDEHPSFHASSLADKNFCLVKSVLNEIVPGKPDVIPPSVLSIFMTGIDIHKKHQKFYRKMGMAYYIEQTVYSEFLDMTGTPDAIINFLNMTTVSEIKSMNFFQFNKLQEAPYNAYVQALVYMYICAIPQAIVIIENKNNQQIKPYLIEFNLKDCLVFIKRRRLIMKCLEKNIIPLSRRLCEKPNKRKRCKYNEICFDKKYLKKILKKVNNENFGS